jgi:hypothetical protein
LCTVDKAIKEFTAGHAAWLDAGLDASSLREHVAAAHSSAGLCDDEEDALEAFVLSAVEEAAMEACLADEGGAVLSSERCESYKRHYTQTKAGGKSGYFHSSRLMAALRRCAWSAWAS